MLLHAAAALFKLGVIVLMHGLHWSPLPPIAIRVDGHSMEPSLHTGDILWVSPLPWRKIRRNDVVICRYPGRGGGMFVKRAVGMPGDVVWRKQGVTFINGLPLDALGRRGGRDYAPCVLGYDEYFCVGDNRPNSHDSRWWHVPGRAVGPIKRREILAVAVKRMRPSTDSGRIPAYEAPVWVPFRALPEPKYIEAEEFHEEQQ